MTINYIKDVGFSESKLLLPVFLLLMASFYACNSKKEAVPQTVVSEPDEPQNTAITLYLQPYNGFPEEQILNCGRMCRIVFATFAMRTSTRNWRRKYDCAQCARNIY